MGFPDCSGGKESACQCRRCRKHGFNPWVGKIPWRKMWQPTRVFFPGESYGERSLEATVCRVAKSQTWLSSHRVDSKGDSCIPYTQFILLKSCIRMMHLLPLMNYWKSESENLSVLSNSLWTPITVHGILQPRILKWAAFLFFMWSSQPRDWTHVSRIAGGFFISWATR